MTTSELRRYALRQECVGRIGDARAFRTLANTLEQALDERLLERADVMFLLSRDQSFARRISDDQGRAAVAIEEEEFRDRLRKLSLLPPEGLRMMVEHLRDTFAAETIELADGTTGYYERGTRTDDCWAAAVATCLQVPIDRVPDPRLDERLQAGENPVETNRAALLEFARWLDDRSLRMTVHRTMPVARKRWIGIVEFPGLFMDHCLVMSRDEILFDPVDRTKFSRRVRAYTAADVTLGYSFRHQSTTSEEGK